MIKPVLKTTVIGASHRIYTELVCYLLGGKYVRAANSIPTPCWSIPECICLIDIESGQKSCLLEVVSSKTTSEST